MSAIGAAGPGFDLLINGGTVVDGTGRPSYTADIGISHGVIAAVGDLSGASAPETLNATGMSVSPGFVDIHSHSDYTLLVDGRAASQISQGVTTELVGNCGHGCAPLTENRSRFVPNIYGYTGDVEMTWRTTAEFLDALSLAKPAVNVAALVPNGNLRLAALENPAEPATSSELTEMTALLEEGLDAGAFGLSLGLEYPAETDAPEDELIGLASVVAERNGLLAVHTANKDAEAVEAVGAAVRIARSAEVALQVSHIVPRRGAPPGALADIVELLERTAQSYDSWYDVHTRLHGITNLAAALPPDLLESSPSHLRTELQKREVRMSVRSRSGVVQSFAVGGWDHVFLRTSKDKPELAGMSFEQIGRMLDMEPWDAVFHVLIESADDISEPMCMCLSYVEADIVATARQPHCLVGSDATALCLDGPLADREFHGAYTWASWAFSRLVDGTGGISVESAVKKLSADPASRLGLSDRGRIAKGLAADIAVFSHEEFKETGTLDSPNSFCTGVRDVIVNGGLAMRGGKLTGASSGKVLRKG